MVHPSCDTPQTLRRRTRLLIGLGCILAVALAESCLLFDGPADSASPDAASPADTAVDTTLPETGAPDTDSPADTDSTDVSPADTGRPTDTGPFDTTDARPSDTNSDCPDPCTPDTKRCVDSNDEAAYEVCKTTGGANTCPHWVRGQCPANQVCQGSPGECRAPACSDGEKWCIDAHTAVECVLKEGTITKMKAQCTGDVECYKGSCVEPSCTDGRQNGDETGEDCGGSCPDACPRGEGCQDPSDCQDGLTCNSLNECNCPARCKVGQARCNGMTHQRDDYFFCRNSGYPRCTEWVPRQCPNHISSDRPVGCRSPIERIFCKTGGINSCETEPCGSTGLKCQFSGTRKGTCRP